ncbi:DUF4124 domain-containing protein [Dyella japonica]|uniref:DUF4124 domain-containing protein n=1 Tax=Dyella japonica A8 TaxID=1217721 RepID=A0A075K9G8_9GAMM|nr:DUF4124 domain-containing protein [Dyella japonica]AIF48853.1 hypothetical protein HY57_17200 [Dyella japonica A8]
MRWYPFFALCLFAATAHGQSVFECKQKDGATSYQDTPCPGKPNDPPAVTFAKPAAGALTEQQRRQAMALIDHFLDIGQFAPAVDIAQKNGLESYLQQRMSVRTHQHPAGLAQGAGAISSPLRGSDHQPGTPTPSSQPSPVACLDKTRLTNRMSPVELWRSIGSCISSGRYDDGIFMFALAGSYGAFDRQRVVDVSAHQASQLLPMVTYASLPADKVSAFQSLASKTLEDMPKRLVYCKEVARMGPPEYFPGYMVQHGLGPFTGAHMAQPLVVPFDAKAAWARAVKQYLLCP